ncbi:hypothetical protein [Pelagicoccus sp. SDUM812003]|uniref:hypothetical protein n=1 Tax=Pelagicoccus sp. SDUM812003 TaxID=3041267 RepID=UPI00280D61EB|nr:hypothetical protein [Pelagicoccus sp. SDUM812003]MDQ8204405.1 hypothetical protein [Pelagicoccus sp. SDUM812003]
MSRRKKPSPSKLPSILNRLIGYTLCLILVLGAFGLGTIYLRHQTAQAANQLKKLEYQIAERKVQISEQGAQITRLTTRSSLKQLNALYDLGLQMPRERQIVRVLEDPTKRLYEKASDSMLTVSSF